MAVIWRCWTFALNKLIKLVTISNEGVSNNLIRIGKSRVSSYMIYLSGIGCEYTNNIN